MPEKDPTPVEETKPEPAVAAVSVELIVIKLEDYTKHLQQAYFESRGTPAAWRYRNAIEKLVEAQAWLKMKD